MDDIPEKRPGLSMIPFLYAQSKSWAGAGALAGVLSLLGPLALLFADALGGALIIVLAGIIIVTIVRAFIGSVSGVVVVTIIGTPAITLDGIQSVTNRPAASPRRKLATSLRSPNAAAACPARPLTAQIIRMVVTGY